MNPDIAGLADRIRRKRAGLGIREAAKLIGISPATLSRVENEKIPDLETFGKICLWLGDDPGEYLGLRTGSGATRVQVHFKKDSAIDKASAAALSELIQRVHFMLREEQDIRS